MEAPLLPEPFRIKVVENLRRTTRKERLTILEEAGWNVFLLPSETIYVDLLTDSGTGAMSDRQWSALMRGDESYAGSRSFDSLSQAVRDLFGFPYVLPTHQGRGAENALNAAWIRPGDVVVGNAPFDTTRAHIEHRGGTVVDVVVRSSEDPLSDDPFKGNLDLSQLEEALEENGERVRYVLVTATCNTVGGHPVSLENLRKVSALAREFGVPLLLDAARCAENAYLVQQREPKESQRSVREILREMMDLVDGIQMSAKKDALVNIGGFLAFRSRELYDKVAPYVVLYEGFLTYGGLAGRDLEAMAVGLYEGTDESYLAYRVGQVHHLGRILEKRGVPIVRPVGGHAVFVDACRFLPHLDRDSFPAQSLVGHLYIEGGVRAVEVGSVMAGRDPKTGKNRTPPLDLVRLAVPRRVYTVSHLEYVAEVFQALSEKRGEISGVEFEVETPILRHFTSRFRPRRKVPT